MRSSPLTRNHPRYPVHKIASYYYGDKQFLTLTLDLGVGGMKIKTHHCLPQNELLNFKLILDNDSIWVKGRVAYSSFPRGKDGASGIEFIELSPYDHTSLQRYLAALKEWPRPRSMLSTRGKDDVSVDIAETGEQ